LIFRGKNETKKDLISSLLLGCCTLFQGTPYPEMKQCLPQWIQRSFIWLI